MEKQQLELLNSFEEDNKWFYEHINFLRERGFTGKYVAVKNKKEIAVDKDINKVIKLVRDSGEDPSFIFIEFVYPKEYILLL